MNAFMVSKTTGAILANGRSGRETTLCTEQKEFFDKKLAILCLQTNLMQFSFV